MAYLRHDSGGPAELNNGQVLGDDSPLQFDADGYAGPIDDEDARVIQAMHTHVEAVATRPSEDAESGASADATDETPDGSDSDDDADESAGTCQHVLSSGDREGEVCGRDLPCPYHEEG